MATGEFPTISKQLMLARARRPIRGGFHRLNQFLWAHHARIGGLNDGRLG